MRRPAKNFDVDPTIPGVSLLDPAVIAVFASDIDNRSNDPVLLAAALEESE